MALGCRGCPLRSAFAPCECALGLCSTPVRVRCGVPAPVFGEGPIWPVRLSGGAVLL